MDLFSKCKELYEKIRYFEYGIPVDGVIKPVPSAEYFAKNYHFLKPEEFEKYGGGICWDYVEYERKFLEVNDIDFNQYYLITNTPPNYDTHTFITVKDGDELIYIESSFKRVEHIIDGVQKFKSLEDIVKLITTNMWYCNGNDKRFDEFKYDVCKFKGHPQYGCTCEEYMKWMDDNSDIVIQDVSINPKKVNEDELAVEEFSVNKIDTKFTQFVCESTNDPEEYDEALHDHIDDEDDIYNESWTDFKNGVHPSSGLMFHVSLKNDMDGKTINPQLPSYITDGGELDDNYQEDTKTKRLCVSPSIEGCLIAILSYNKIREHVGDKFYVYTPEKPFSQYKHKTNKEIVKDKLVFDANITKEAWILEPCKLKLYGIIKLKKVKDLKKKPTVEKNIKMNTIKLDYEWIMTPKASGKFNKAIGDSPDEESDKKKKPIKEYDNILVSNEEFFMEANKNLVKSLKILDYDPKTKTIKCDIPRYDGKPNKRVIFLIDDYISREKGDGSVGSVAAKKELLEEYRSRTSNPEKLKAIDADIKYLNTRNDDELAISIPRKILKTRNLQNLITVNHELGHIYCRETPSDDEWKEMQRWQRTRDEYNDIDGTVKNGNHAISTEELYADTYAADKVSAHALQKTDEKTFKKFKQDMYGYIKKAKVKQQKILNRLKSLPNELTEEEEFEIKKQMRELVIEIRKLHKPGLPDSQQDPKALAMFKEALKLEKKLDRSKDLPFEKNMIEMELDHVGDVLDLYASAIKNLNIEHLTHHAYANKKDRIKFESFSVLVSNEEFFMEASKNERRRQREIEANLQKDVSERDSERSRESVNEKHRDKKEAKHLEDMAKSKPKKSSSNRNKIKILNILDYDPKTNTIKGNIKLPDGSIKKRIPYIIENKVMGQTGPALMTIDEFKQQIELLLSDEEETFFFDKPTLSGAERGTMEKVLKSLERFEAAGEKFIIAIPRVFLNKRHFTGLGASLHELGHLNYALDNSDSAEMDRAKKYRDDMKDKLTKDSPSWKHLAEDDPEVKKLTGYDSSNEFSADKYAADRIGIRNYEKMLKNLISFAKRTSRKPVEDMVKKTVENMDMYLKLDEYNDAFGESNRKFLKRVRKSILDTSDYISNSIQDADKSIIEHKQHVKEIDKKMAELNKQIKEYKSRSVALVSSCNNLVKEIDRLQKERDEHSEEIRNKRTERKDAQTRADTAINSGFSNMLKNLRKQIADYYKWLTDYDIELESRVNYVKKFYEKKNIGESCLIMDNEEFFNLTE